MVGLDDFFGFSLNPVFLWFPRATEEGFINFQQEERAVCILLYLLSIESKPWSSTWKPPPQLWASFFSARSWVGCTQHCYSIINGLGQINQWPDPGKNTKYRDIRQYNSKIISRLLTFSTHQKNPLTIKYPFIQHTSLICQPPVSYLWMRFSAAWPLFCLLTPQVELSTAVIWAQPSGIRLFKGILPR